MNRAHYLAIFMTLLYTTSFSQKGTISCKGIMISYNDRISFFKSNQTSISRFLVAKKDTGIELTNGYLTENLFKKAEVIKVIRRAMNYKGVIETDTVNFKAVPIILDYKKVESKYKSGLCNLGFEKDNITYTMDFFCNETDFIIMTMRPLRKSK